MKSDKPTLGYLSAAPRVSTRSHAEASGPRAHVLGVMKGFEDLGWDVKPYIVGDRLPNQWSGTGSERKISDSRFATLAADVLRISMGSINARKAWSEFKDRVDMVYERFAVLQSLGFRFKNHGIPWILETNALYFKEAAEERKSILLTDLARKREIRAYQECDVLICISPILKDLIERECEVSGEKLLIVPNGVDTEFFNPDRYPQSQSSDHVTIGFVGHLYPWQGLDLLIRAVSELKEEEGLTFRIRILGDGTTRDQLEQMVSSLKLSSSVRFLGRVPWEEVPGHIAEFDVGYSNKVLSHNKDIYFSPLKTYEYMAMAKPVLSYVGKGESEVIHHHRTGFVFSSESISDLKEALREIYSAKDSLPEIGKRARQEAVLNHSWNSRVKTMYYAIQGILDGKKTSTEIRNLN